MHNLENKEREVLIQEFKKHASDTGSSAYQVVKISFRVAQLTKHLQEHKKDCSARRGLYSLLAQRRAHLRFLARHESDVCQKLLERFSLKL
ncbi:MAG: 30S ribosomal protein S15 [Candidatus Babeliales bacterium]